MSDPAPSTAAPTDRRASHGLADRVEFLRACNVLAGLAPCPPRKAALALLSTADQLNLHPAELARRFLIGVDIVADPLVSRVFSAARNTESLVGAVARPLLQVRRTGGHRQSLEVTGEVDLSTVALLLAATAGAITELQTRASQKGAFRLDLSGLTFCDVSGVRALADLHLQIVTSGAELALSRPRSPGPNRLFQVAVDERWLDRAFAPLPRTPLPQAQP